jgi:hypothetical protein
MAGMKLKAQNKNFFGDPNGEKTHEIKESIPYIRLPPEPENPKP